MQLNSLAQKILNASIAKWKAEEDLRQADDTLKHLARSLQANTPFKRRI
jgi:hypothetical protein